MTTSKDAPKSAPQQLSKDEKRVLELILSQETVYNDVSLNKLKIDYAYQDRPRRLLVAQIAEQFNAVMVGSLIVSVRPNQELWVCDGVTRVLGMREKFGENCDRLVRCQMIHTEGQKQEALLFKYYNSARKQVPLANRLQAEGIAGIDNGFLKAVRAAGFEIVGSKKNTLKGVGFVNAAFKLDDGESLRKALFAIRSEWSGHNRIDGNTVLGIASVYHSQPKPVDDQIRKLLRRMSPSDLDNKIATMWGGGPKVGASLRPSDRPRFVAKAITQQINKSPGKHPKLDIRRVDAVFDDELAAA